MRPRRLTAGAVIEPSAVKANRLVSIDPELYRNGRFASTRDPEGNPIQLGEPK